MNFKSLKVFNKPVAIITGLLMMGTSGNLFAQAEVAAAAGESHIGRIVLFYCLIGLVAVFFLSLVGKILKVLELSYEVSGKKSGIAWNKVNGFLFLMFLIVGMGAAWWEFGYHGKMLLPESASEHGLLTDNLFNVTLIITGIVFVLTHILLFGYAFKYQGKKERKAYFYPHNNKLELYWTIIPAIVLTVLVIFGWRTWSDITKPSRQAKNPLTIEVTGEQFRWTTRYAGADNMLGDKNFKLIGGVNELGLDFTDKRNNDDIIVREIVLPVNKPVKFVFAAKDVIHSAYMPHFRLQMNCVPGMPTYFWMTPRTTTEEMRTKVNDPKFEYVLLCAKICGSAHSNMQMKVRVVTEAEYNKWISEQKPFYTEEVKAELKLAAESKTATPAIAIK